MSNIFSYQKPEKYRIHPAKLTIKTAFVNQMFQIEKMMDKGK